MNALRVISVHGISDNILREGYSLRLRDLLKERLKKIGVIPKDATETQIAKIITFEEANYSDIGNKAEDLYLAAYAKENLDLDKSKSLIDKLIDSVKLAEIRRLVITSVSDGLVYQNQACKDEMRTRVEQIITPHAGSGDAVTVIAHSLGAVVAFDSIYWNVWNNQKWVKAKFLPTNLFTMGSPLALFSLELEECDTQKQKDKYDPTMKDNFKLVSPAGKWINFMDAQDLIAYPVHEYFKGKYAVDDVLVNTGLDPYTAHLKYWENDDVVDTIAERLKIDYKRLKS